MCAIKIEDYWKMEWKDVESKQILHLPLFLNKNKFNLNNILLPKQQLM